MCCRKENVEGSKTSQNLYIATLGVLAPYRRLGLGTNRELRMFSYNRIKGLYRSLTDTILDGCFSQLLATIRIQVAETRLGECRALVLDRAQDRQGVPSCADQQRGGISVLRETWICGDRGVQGLLSTVRKLGRIQPGEALALRRVERTA